MVYYKSKVLNLEPVVGGPCSSVRFFFVVSVNNSKQKAQVILMGISLIVQTFSHKPNTGQILTSLEYFQGISDNFDWLLAVGANPGNPSNTCKILV